MKSKLLLVLSIITSLVYGQGNSPYSFYGPGDILGSTFQSNFQKGGIGASTAYKFQINPLNPASYSRLKFTVGEVGVFSSNNTYSNNNGEGSTNYTNLGAFGLGFPLMKNWGMAFGLQPFTKQNYSYSVSDQLPDLSNVEYIYEGIGGLSKLFLGTGYKIKDVSFGVNGNFIFGQLTDISKVRYETDEFRNTRFRDYTKVRGLGASTGIQYDFSLNEEVNATFGVSYDVESRFTTDNYTQANYFDYKVITNENNEQVLRELHENEFIIDNSETPTKGELVLPQSLQTGLTLEKDDKWMLSAEYQFSSWSEFVWEGKTNQMSNSQKFMVAGSIIPNSQALGRENYWKSITYTAALHYGDGRIVHDGAQLPEYGINLGIGFPLRKLKYETEKFGSYINLSAGYMHRGNGDASIISEDYFNLNLSVILNDKWFIKRKFN